MQYENCGPYLLLEKLASGGMAEVYLAKAPGAEGVSKFLAVKRILPQYSSNEDFIDMFKAEAKIAININHVNIVPIYEFGEYDKQFFLAMEFVLGKNLRQIISKVKKSNQVIPIEHIVFLINETAKGLDYAHRFIDRSTGKPLNIIHRDMSPQNIMVSYEGEVKIVDFGIAKAESKLESTQAGTLKGKFGYMSPEQVDGLELDYRTDIFSLGTVLWELLANDRLFISNNEVNTIKKIRDCHIPPLSKINPNIPAELENIATKALARDRSLRYQSASEMHRDLNRFLNKAYPEYASQDFAQFVKKIYLQEIIEMRDKLIEYAKVEVPKFISEASEHTKTITSTGETLKNAPSVEFKEITSTENIDFKSGIRLTENSLTLSKYKNQVVPVHKRFSENPNTVTISQNKKSSSLTTALSLCLLLLAGFFHFNPESLALFKSYLGMQGNENVLISSENPNTSETTNRIASYSFYVKSSPPRAKIYVDEKDTGIYTPGRINVRPDTSFSLTLRRTGFIDYRRQITATAQGQQFKATLQRSQTGFVTIRSPISAVDIYINGSKISEKPPVEKYAVPASTNIHIRIINPITNTFDETTVNLREDTHQEVNLFPRRKL